MTFEQWWKKTTGGMVVTSGEQYAAELAWQAAQQAERERERGKVLAEGWDDRYAALADALVTERERAKALVDALKEVGCWFVQYIGSSHEPMEWAGAMNKVIKAAIAKYEGESNDL